MASSQEGIYPDPAPRKSSFRSRLSIAKSAAVPTRASQIIVEMFWSLRNPLKVYLLQSRLECGRRLVLELDLMSVPLRQGDGWLSKMHCGSDGHSTWCPTSSTPYNASKRTWEFLCGPPCQSMQSLSPQICSARSKFIPQILTVASSSVLG